MRRTGNAANGSCVGAATGACPPNRPRAIAALTELGPSIGLLLFVVVLYLPSVSNDFIYDDHEVILAQPVLRGPADLARVFTEPHYIGLPYYRPITRASLLLQKTWHGDRPGPFHLVNAALMGLTAVLVYRLLLWPVFEIKPPMALLAAALLAAHPIASACVYPISSGRETLLPTLFVLASVTAYLHPGRRSQLLALCCFAGALLCKEQAVVVPLLLLLADLLGLSARSPVAGAVSNLLRRQLPFVLLLAAYFAIRWLLFGAQEYEFAAARTPLAVIWAYGYALQVVFAPSVALVYEPTEAIWPSTLRLLLAGSAVLLLVSAATRFKGRDRAVAGYWACWFLVALLPTANLLQQEARYAERYALLALVAVVALVAQVGSAAWSHPCGRRLAMVFGVSLLAGAASISWHRHGYYHDDIAFCRQWLLTNPRSVSAHNVLGAALAKRGLLEAAIHHHQRALEIKPDSIEALNQLGLALAWRGQLEESLAHLRRAVQINPQYARAFNSLGMVLSAQGKLDDAIAQFSHALHLSPNSAEIHNNLGVTLADKGDLVGAVRQFALALEMKPDYHKARANLNETQARQREQNGNQSQRLP